MRTAVVTDSNSGITKEEAEKMGIFLIPMPVIIDGDTHFEGQIRGIRGMVETLQKLMK